MLIIDLLFLGTSSLFFPDNEQLLAEISCLPKLNHKPSCCSFSPSPHNSAEKENNGGGFGLKLGGVIKLEFFYWTRPLKRWTVRTVSGGKHLQPTIIIATEKIFSQSVAGAMLPKPMVVRLVMVK